MFASLHSGVSTNFKEMLLDQSDGPKSAAEKARGGFCQMEGILTTDFETNAGMLLSLATPTESIENNSVSLPYR